MIIKRFDAWSVGRIYGILSASMGLVIGLIVAMFSIVGSSVARSSDLPPFMSTLFGVGAIVLLPICYGIIGVLSGMLAAALYNVFAGVVGGISVQVE